jgi:Tetrapyrrole (Corrin/Porphyrin) Methylases
MTAPEPSPPVQGDRSIEALADALRAAARLVPEPQIQPTVQEHLVVAGTGIHIGQLTIEAAGAICRADRVHYSTTEPVSEALILALNARAEPLMPLYEFGKPRSESYELMVETILRSVRAGHQTAAVFYGHPGVFAFPPHEVIRRARSEGFRARMLAAVSAEDCLFADLGIDPAESGVQSLEATDFLLRMRSIDTSQALILWQIGVLGEWDFQGASYDLKALPMLVRKLRETYPSSHPAIVYEAASMIGAEPRVERTTIAAMVSARLTPISTLVVPPMKEAGFDLAYAAWLPLPDSRK